MTKKEYYLKLVELDRLVNRKAILKIQEAHSLSPTIFMECVRTSKLSSKDKMAVDELLGAGTFVEVARRLGVSNQQAGVYARRVWKHVVMAAQRLCGVLTDDYLGYFLYLYRSQMVHRNDIIQFLWERDSNQFRDLLVFSGLDNRAIALMERIAKSGYIYSRLDLAEKRARDMALESMLCRAEEMLNNEDSEAFTKFCETLPSRIVRILRQHGFSAMTWEDLMKGTGQDLSSIRGIGKTSQELIKERREVMLKECEAV